MKLSCLTLLLLGFGSVVAAQESQYAPPPGIAIPPDIRDELHKGVLELDANIKELRQIVKAKPTLLTLLPDVEIFHKAVEWPLLYDEFYRSNEFAIARTLLRQGMERAQALRNGETPWTTATGLVVRGFLSKIDRS